MIDENPRQTDICDERSFLLLLLPIMGAAVFGQLYSPISAGIAGRYRSAEAVAVMGSCAFLLTLRHFLFEGMAIGFGVYLCRFIGQEDQEELPGVFWGAVYLSLGLAAAALCLLPAAGLALGLLKVPEQLMPEAREYTCWILGTFASGIFKTLLLWSLQGLKKTWVTGALSAFSLLTQTLCSLLLMGVFRLPVWGSAAAVLISDTVTCLLLLFFLVRAAGSRLSFVRPSSVPPGVLKELLFAGTGKSSMMLLVAVAGFISQRLVNSFSVEQIAGYTYAASVSNVFQVIIGAYGTAAAILCGEWFGRKKTYLLAKELRRLLTHSTAAAIGAVFVIWIFAEPLIRLLGAGAGEPVLVSGVRYLRVSLSALPMLAVYLVSRYSLQSMGNNISQTFLGLVEMLAVFLTLWFLVPALGFAALAWRIVLQWSLSAAAALFLLKRQISRVRQDSRGSSTGL